MLAVGALRADWKYLRRDFGWEKTEHAGHHLDVMPDVTSDEAISA